MVDLVKCKLLEIGFWWFIVGLEGLVFRFNFFSNLFFFFFYRKEMKVKREWPVKVRYLFFSLQFPATFWPFELHFIPIFLWSIQSLTNSLKREPKLLRWRPTYRRPLVATQVEHRELPAERRQADRRTLYLPCRPPTSDLWSPALDLTSSAAPPEDWVTWLRNVSICFLTLCNTTLEFCTRFPDLKRKIIFSLKGSKKHTSGYRSSWWLSPTRWPVLEITRQPAFFFVVKESYSTCCGLQSFTLQLVK